jgi:anti-anti-sigma regulatory factor
MYKIEKNDLGFHLTLGGEISKAELEKWEEESERALRLQQAPFGVIIDMRQLAPLAADAQEVMVRGQAMYRSRGMQRSSVILEDAITTIQFMRLARRSGINKYERYIDASTLPDWLQAARNWIEHAIAPTR